MRAQRDGILLINTGSPDSPEVPDVRRYLKQFLSDPRVIDIAPLARWLLLNLVILPFRPKQSGEAYASIWTDRGSPLILHSEDFRDRLRERLPEALVEIGMAYGRPSIAEGMDSLLAQGAGRIVLAPMFPQYASATVGSVLEFSYKTAAEKPNVPPVSVLPPFYEEPEFLDAWATIARPQLEAFQPDHIVMSYHGLPERQIFKCDPTGSHCLKAADCCDRYLDANPMCYRAHCLATTRGIAERLGMREEDFTLAFQSKLGRDPWLTPATDETIEALAKRGVKRLAVLSPAFVADCIETIEEIGMQAKEAFEENGGEQFLLVTSLNSEPVWADAFTAILRRNALNPRR
jgi:protoporphyrin/coproporphyrin ferrochelatase